MKLRFIRRLLACVIGVTGLATSAKSSAQEVDSQTLVVRPMAVADPPLTHSLLPPLRDQIPGNAVVWYGQVYAEQQALLQRHDLWDQIGELVNLPSNDLAENHSDFKWLGSQPVHSGVFGALQKAARSRHCDWQLLNTDDPYFEILLPEVQRARSYARLIVLRVKYQIADKRFDDALESLQLGFALAKHVAQGDTLVCTLVAIGIEDMMADCLFDWVQQPDAPNLTWALAELPDPLVDLRPGLDAELIGLESTYPLFAQARQIEQRQPDRDGPSRDESQSTRKRRQNWRFVEWSTDQWTDALRDFWDRSDLFGGNRNRSRPALGLLVMEAYPRAKASLIRSGYPADQVEEFSVAQAIAVQSYNAHQRQIQNLVRWAYQPTSVALAGLQQESDGDAPTPPALPVDEMLGSSIQTVVHRQANIQRKIAALRWIEALRDHAATHGGELPASIDELKVLPIPNDPATGAPFTYSRNGSTIRIATPDDPTTKLSFRPIGIEIRTQGDK
ncbi:MAG: hypothetical protein F9B45_01265 [Phycisphaera sp. RhM]|nr:hypothetical protein [Phycisphaera sp. RhM]